MGMEEQYFYLLHKKEWNLSKRIFEFKKIYVKISHDRREVKGGITRCYELVC